MSKKSLLALALFIALSSLFMGCHKYPEDPFISLKQAGKRLLGTWNITSYKINGVEHSHDFDSLLSPNTLTDCYIFFEAGDLVGDGEFKFQDKNKQTLFPSGGFNTFSFEGDKNKENTKLFFYPIDSTNVFGHLFFYGQKKTPTYFSDGEWTILELYGENLHITYNGRDVYFKKQ